MSAPSYKSELIPSPWWVWLAALLVTVAVTAVDLTTGGHYSVLPLYLIPVCVSAWLIGAAGWLSVVVLCAAGWWTAQAFGETPAFEGWFALQNAVMRAVVFASVGWLTWLLRRSIRLSRDVARADVISGLTNRAGFYSDATALLADARSSRASVALFMVDVTGLRSINRRFGHARGDLVLALAAQAFGDAPGSTACIARTGSDELAMIQLRRTPQEVEQVARAIADRLADVPRLVGCVVGFRVVATRCDEPPLSLDDLLAYSEELLSRSRGAGVHVVMANYPDDPDRASPAGASRTDSAA